MGDRTGVRAAVVGTGFIGVVHVDAGVEQGDRDARAVEPGGPGLGCPDLGHALVQARLDASVEPQLGEAGPQRRRGVARVEGRRDRVPERADVTLGRGQGRAS